MPLIWKEGKRIEATMAEFIAQLRSFAKHFSERFGHCSDMRGHVDERIEAAADELERFRQRPPRTTGDEVRETQELNHKGHKTKDTTAAEALRRREKVQ